MSDGGKSPKDEPMSDDDDDRRPERKVSRSRSRSRSPRGRSRSKSPMMDDRSRSPARGGEEAITESITVSDADAAFVLGRGGSTKLKIARVSGARLDLQDRDGRLDIFGTDKARSRAKDYVNYVLTQRTGPVFIDTTEKRDDLSIVNVPEDCVGYVMGRGGQVLRSMEEEWGTLMFFAKTKGSSGDGQESEILAIFGSRRGRRGAELKVMSAVEHKQPGFFLDGDKLKAKLDQPGDDEGDDFDYDTFPFQGDEFSYALGARGSTRKKLAAAAGCILEYIGQVAVIAGRKRERRQGRDYLEWLLKQKSGNLYVDAKGRDDVTEIDAPRSAIGYVTGHKGEGLRGIEHETRTFCFTNAKKSEEGDEANEGSTETIMVFGDDADDRRRAKRIIEDRIDQALRNDRGGGGGGGGGYGRYDDRGRGRSPPRYDDRGRGGYSPPRGGYGGGSVRSDICYDFQRGMCNRDRCKFSHDDGRGGGGGRRDDSRDFDRRRSPPRYDDRDRGRDRYDDRDRDRDRYDDRDRDRRDRSPRRDRYDDRDRRY